MNQKKAKRLRKVATAMVALEYQKTGKLLDVKKKYKQMKTIKG
jgi:hypothetical protein